MLKGNNEKSILSEFPLEMNNEKQFYFIDISNRIP